MGSRLTQPTAAATKLTLPLPVITLSDNDYIMSMAYLPDGKRMISVCKDKTIRQWDLHAGKEIEEVRDVYEGIPAEVSRDGRWVMTVGGDEEYVGLKAYEIETGIVKTFQDSRARIIRCIDISADGKLLASGSMDTVLIWGMDTGKLVAGSFESDGGVYRVRFSPDSKKLAVILGTAGKCLEVWDVQTQKLDARMGKNVSGFLIQVSIFWTKRGTILAPFSFDYNYLEPRTIYEFDASTLKTVGDPLEGHTHGIRDIALSFDDTLLASSSFDNTIKLWSLEPRQLLASFHVQPMMWFFHHPMIFSPDTRQLAYLADRKIFICNTPPDILASIRLAPNAQAIVSAPDKNVRRNPATSPMISLPPRPPQPIHTRGLQQPVFFRYLRNLLSLSSHMNVVPPVQNSQPRDPLDIPATSFRIDDHTPVVHTIHEHSHSDLREHSRHTTALPATHESATAPVTLATRIQYLSRWWPIHTSHQASPIVNVPLAQGLLRNAAAGAPNNDEDLIPEEYFDTSSQNPDSQQPSATARIDTGEHGHGGWCFCF